MKWPPPIENMTADELLELHNIATCLINHINQELPHACADEGHRFGKEEKHEIVISEGTYYPPSGNTFCDPGVTEGRETIPGYKRTCSRCGKIEIKKAIIEVKSPWSN